MASLEFVLTTVCIIGIILLIIAINAGIFIYKFYKYGRDESSQPNSVSLTEVSIPCTISANIALNDGLGPNRRLSELVVRGGELMLINYSTPDGKIHVKKLNTGSTSTSPSTSNPPLYEDLPPSYELCIHSTEGNNA